ncbi:MAG: ABC transporter ATP-binding protein [Kiritimatiellia bacterium]
MPPLLEITNLTISFDTDDGPITAVKNLSLSIEQGQILGLVGESGCGKSVTAMSILRLLPKPAARVDSGSILFHGHDLTTLPLPELQSIRGSRIAMIFQEPMTALSPLHRVGRQLVEVLQIHRKMPEKQAWPIAAHWLQRVGLPDAEQRMYAYPHQLSGGQRQRVMIAMALMLDPALLIADEPTTALDVTVQAQIFDLMHEMHKKNTGMLFITHDMGAIWQMCTHVAVMYATEIVETGTVQEVFANPRHPYTQALLAAIPANATPGDLLPAIPGQVPSPQNLPAGCHFHDRCPKAFARCRDEHPALYATRTGLSRCFLSENEA